jgi:hypothetical protein
MTLEQAQAISAIWRRQQGRKTNPSAGIDHYREACADCDSLLAIIHLLDGLLCERQDVLGMIHTQLNRLEPYPLSRPSP